MYVIDLLSNLNPNYEISTSSIKILDPFFLSTSKSLSIKLNKVLLPVPDLPI